MIHDCVCQSCQSTQPPEMYGEVAYCSECGLPVADFLHYAYDYTHQRVVDVLAGQSAGPIHRLSAEHRQKIQVAHRRRRKAAKNQIPIGKEVIDVELGAKVRALRIGQKLTQDRLAEIAGINVMVISRIERGRARYLNNGELEKLADALSVPVDELQPERELTCGRWVKVV